MALPKGKLMALLAVFAAIGLITATGAFTTVEATRTVEVSVQGDATALVGLTPASSSNGYNGGSAGSSNGYADIQDGVLVINLGGFDAGTPDNQGVNYDAVTQFDAVFVIQNNGENDVSFTLDRSGGNAPQAVTFHEGTSPAYDSNSNVTASSFTLTPGASKTISIQVNTTGITASDVAAGNALIEDISITANEV